MKQGNAGPSAPRDLSTILRFVLAGGCCERRDLEQPRDKLLQCDVNSMV